MIIWRLMPLLLLLLLIVVLLLPPVLASPVGGPDELSLESAASPQQQQPISAGAKRIKYSKGDSKDSFLIHPSTRWCGVGTLATNYTTLGNAYESDKCCRDHDHCDNVIHAKETRYHLTSIFHFTISNCECDIKFYNCLTSAGDSQGNSVIDWFFRLIQVPCFELVKRQVCVETRRVSMFSDVTECVRNGTDQVAELRQLPFFTDELERMRREQGVILYS